MASQPWTATESTDFAGGNRHLTVAGEVATTMSNQKPVLTEAVPQGFNPKILILDLTIEETGVGLAVIGVAPALFVKPVSERQYTEVTVRRAGAAEIQLQVQLLVS